MIIYGGNKSKKKTVEYLQESLTPKHNHKGT